jgi:hypothetical protein
MKNLKSRRHQVVAKQRPRERTLPRLGPLLTALRGIDRAREVLRQSELQLQHILAAAVLPEAGEEYADADEDIAAGWNTEGPRDVLQKAWSEFKAAGGVTVGDLQNWLQGRSIGRLNKRSRGKKHLRLIACKSTPRVRLRSRLRGDDEAA